MLKHIDGYSVTLCGKVVGKRGSILKPVPKGNGYITFSRSNGYGNPQQTLLHRFMWEYWVGPIPEGYTIDHINGDKADNRLHNLQCVTQKHNARKSNLKLTTAQVELIREYEGSYASFARGLGVSPQLACCIRKGRAYKDNKGKEHYIDENT